MILERFVGIMYNDNFYDFYIVYRIGFLIVSKFKKKLKIILFEYLC